MALLIVIDPGHGGNDPGAAANGMQEKDLTLDIARKVLNKLADYQVDVRLTREEDNFTSLAERSRLANAWAADYYISIHVNAGGGSGFESYIHREAGQSTTARQQRLHQIIYSYLKGFGFTDRGTKRANFAVLRETDMPAVLIECLFLDAEKDVNALKDVGFREGLAKSVADGLVAALNLPRKTQPIVTPPVDKPTQPTQPNQHWATAAFAFIKAQGLVASEHNLDSPVTWGELAMVVKRLMEK